MKDKLFRELRKIKDELRYHWSSYVFQSGLAALVLAIVFLFLRLHNAVVIASIGSTAFIVFALPNNIAAQPRNVIGGNVTGLICGSICAFIPHETFLVSIVLYSFAVGLSIFLMVLTDTEHPPASGVALGIAMADFSLRTAIAVVASAVILSLAHDLLKEHLRDLS